VRSLVRGAISLRRTNVSLSGMGGTSNDEVVEEFFVLMTVLAGGTGSFRDPTCSAVCGVGIIEMSGGGAVFQLAPRNASRGQMGRFSARVGSGGNVSLRKLHIS
jgi:hypothetical protein